MFMLFDAKRGKLMKIMSSALKILPKNCTKEKLKPYQTIALRASIHFCMVIVARLASINTHN